MCSDLGETESHNLRVCEGQVIWNIYCVVSFAQKAKYHLNNDKSQLEDDWENVNIKFSYSTYSQMKKNPLISYKIPNTWERIHKYSKYVSKITYRNKSK